MLIILVIENSKISALSYTSLIKYHDKNIKYENEMPMPLRNIYSCERYKHIKGYLVKHRYANYTDSIHLLAYHKYCILVPRAEQVLNMQYLWETIFLTIS